VREAATICHRSLQVDLWPFDLESGVRVTCDVAYLCANFSLPRPLCSRLRPDVRDRQTDVSHASLLNASALRCIVVSTGSGIKWWDLTETIIQSTHNCSHATVKSHCTVHVGKYEPSNARRGQHDIKKRRRQLMDKPLRMKSTFSQSKTETDCNGTDTFEKRMMMTARQKNCYSGGWGRQTNR